MAVYELALDFFPFSRVYSRNQEEVESWLKIFEEKESIFNIDLSDWKKYFEEKRKDKLNSNLIKEVSVGYLTLDSPGWRRLPEKENDWNLEIASDFRIKTTPEFIPDFRDCQERLEKNLEKTSKIGALYAIASHRGMIKFANYISKEIIEDIIDYNISPKEFQAMRHIQESNRIFGESPDKFIVKGMAKKFSEK